MRNLSKYTIKTTYISEIDFIDHLMRAIVITSCYLRTTMLANLEALARVPHFFSFYHSENCNFFNYSISERVAHVQVPPKLKRKNYTREYRSIS
tara:strand:+ start:1166 stop:1447 length:282 start_codon:yes stop_codon:yes gene_type:complete